MRFIDVQGWVEESNDITTEYIGMGIHVISGITETGNVNKGPFSHLNRGKEVVAFRRSNGWVQQGYDPIRKVQPPLTSSGNRRDDLPSSRHPS